MLPYTNRARSQDTRQNFELARSCTYDLQSVVVHVGNLETGELLIYITRPLCSLINVPGHYVSYSRVGNQVSVLVPPCFPLLFQLSHAHIPPLQWFKFNDHNVTLATKSQVLNEQAFILFYVIQSLA